MFYDEKQIINPKFVDANSLNYKRKKNASSD